MTLTSNLPSLTPTVPSIMKGPTLSPFPLKGVQCGSYSLRFFFKDRGTTVTLTGGDIQAIVMPKEPTAGPTFRVLLTDGSEQPFKLDSDASYKLTRECFLEAGWPVRSLATDVTVPTKGVEVCPAN